MGIVWRILERVGILKSSRCIPGSGPRTVTVDISAMQLQLHTAGAPYITDVTAAATAALDQETGAGTV